jgi:hypothetical protein
MTYRDVWEWVCKSLLKRREQPDRYINDPRMYSLGDGDPRKISEKVQETLSCLEFGCHHWYPKDILKVASCRSLTGARHPQELGQKVLILRSRLRAWRRSGVFTFLQIVVVLAFCGARAAWFNQLTNTAGDVIASYLRILRTRRSGACTDVVYAEPGRPLLI